MSAAVWLALATLISKDGAALTAGWLVRRGELDAVTAVTA